MKPLSDGGLRMQWQASSVPSWGPRFAVLAVAVQSLALPARAWANYGGNTYGGSDITLVVCGIMAVIGCGWAIWYSLRRLRRAQVDRNPVGIAAKSGNATEDGSEQC